MAAGLAVLIILSSLLCILLYRLFRNRRIQQRVAPLDKEATATVPPPTEEDLEDPFPAEKQGRSIPAAWPRTDADKDEPLGACRGKGFGLPPDLNAELPTGSRDTSQPCFGIPHRPTSAPKAARSQASEKPPPTAGPSAEAFDGSSKDGSFGGSVPSWDEGISRNYHARRAAAPGDRRADSPSSSPSHRGPGAAGPNPRPTTHRSGHADAGGSTPGGPRRSKSSKPGNAARDASADGLGGRPSGAKDRRRRKRPASRGEHEDGAAGCDDAAGGAGAAPSEPARAAQAEAEAPTGVMPSKGEEPTVDVIARLGFELDGEMRKDPEWRQKRFKELMLKWHPDKNPDAVQQATEVFQYLMKRKAAYLLA